MPCMYTCVLNCLLGSLLSTVCKSVSIRDKHHQHGSGTSHVSSLCPSFLQNWHKFKSIQPNSAQKSGRILCCSSSIWKNQTTATVPLLTQIPTSQWTGPNVWLVTEVLQKELKPRPPADRDRGAESASSVSSFQFQIHNGSLKYVPAESDLVLFL